VKKVRKKISLLSENDVEMLYAEIDILSNLNHPNLISFVAAVTDPTNFMIITEYASQGILFYY
jgi:serine/threonine protein kinase